MRNLKHILGIITRHFDSPLISDMGLKIIDVCGLQAGNATRIKGKLCYFYSYKINNFMKHFFLIIITLLICKLINAQCISITPNSPNCIYNVGFDTLGQSFTVCEPGVITKIAVRGYDVAYPSSSSKLWLFRSSSGYNNLLWDG